MKIAPKICFFITGIFSYLYLLDAKEVEHQKVDIVIYSMNRPLQVYALLESIQSYVRGTGNIYVLYRTSDYGYFFGYEEVKKSFPTVLFVHQVDKLNGADFKELHMKCAFESPNNYVSFIVDDSIVKEPIDLSQCIKALELVPNSFAFFLRLGANINECYSLKIKTPPPCKKFSDDFYIWQFKTGMEDMPGWNALTLGDWNFATSNDFCVFRKKDIQSFFEKCNYRGTSYEGIWWEEFRSNPQNMEMYGICFERAKMVNICVNIANEEMANWAQFSENWRDHKLHLYSTKELLNKFLVGYKIDIKDIVKIHNTAPHIEYQYKFVPRESL